MFPGIQIIGTALFTVTSPTSTVGATVVHRVATVGSYFTASQTCKTCKHIDNITDTLDAGKKFLDVDMKALKDIENMLVTLRKALDETRFTPWSPEHWTHIKGLLEPIAALNKRTFDQIASLVSP